MYLSKIIKSHLFYAVISQRKPLVFQQTPCFYLHSYAFASGVDSVLPSSASQRKFSTGTQLDSSDEHVGTVSKDRESSDTKNKEMVKKKVGTFSEEERPLKKTIRKVDGWKPIKEMTHLDVLFKEALERIRNLRLKKGSRAKFETKQLKLHTFFTSEPESSHSMFIRNSSSKEESDTSKQEK